MPVITREDTGFVNPGPPPRLSKSQIDAINSRIDSIKYDRMMKEKKKSQLTTNNPGADNAKITATRAKIGVTKMVSALKPTNIKSPATFANEVDIVYNGGVYDDDETIHVGWDCTGSDSISFSLETYINDMAEGYPLSYTWTIGNKKVVQMASQADTSPTPTVELLVDEGKTTIGVDVTYYTDEHGDQSNVSCTVTLDIYQTTIINSVTIRPSSLLMNVGDTNDDLKATVDPSCANNVFWADTPKNIITIDSASGEVTAINSGITTIYAISTFDQNIYGTCLVTVYPSIFDVPSNCYDCNLSAGADGQTITIKGEGFGKQRGSGYVSFANADKGGFGIVDDKDSYDYNCMSCSWTNQSITMLLPGEVLDHTNHLIPTCIGSGPMMVTNNANFYTEPLSITTINHDYLQYINKDGSVKYNMKLSDNQTTLLSGGNGLVAFKLDLTGMPKNSSGEDTTDAKNCIKRAMTDWSCKLGINITIDPPVSVTTPNIIKFGPLKYGTLGYTIPTGVPDTSVFDNYDAYWSGSDTITLDNSWASWDYDLPEVTTISGNDFYHTVLHELGHALELGHVNISNDLMYYSSDSSSSTRIGLTGDALEGGKYIVGASENLGWLHSSSSACIPPTAPKLSPITPESYQIYLQWNYNPSDVDIWGPPTTYYIERSLNDPSFATFTTISVYPNTTSYNDTVDPNTHYYYRILAQNDYGDSYSNTVSGTTGAPTPPNTISSEHTSVSSSGFPTFTWSDNGTNATYYYVYRCSPSFFGIDICSKVMLNGNTTSYTDSSVLPNHVYYYQIISKNPDGSITSSVITVVTATAPCSSTGDINYANTSSLPVSKYTTGTITAGPNVKITSGQVVYFWAGTKVHLNPGCSALNGSTFQAKIVACTGSTKSAEIDSMGYKSTTDVPEMNTGAIKIYPNPTTGLLTIETGVDKASIGIYNIYGSLLKQQQLMGCINQTDIGNLTPGTYIINVVTGSGQQKAQLIIKR
jgi:hypothetical protein